MNPINSTNLYRALRDIVVIPDIGPVCTIDAGTVLWMHGIRSSSLGGYIGTFSFVYQQINGFSPRPGPLFKIKTDAVDPVF
jgi:hypothetical protein